ISSSQRRPGACRDPYSAAVVTCTVSIGFDWAIISETDSGRGLWVPACAGTTKEGSSRHRKAQRLAAAAHVDRSKSGAGEAAAAAVALLGDLELAVARTELR